MLIYLLVYFGFVRCLLLWEPATLWHKKINQVISGLRIYIFNFNLQLHWNETATPSQFWVNRDSRVLLCFQCSCPDNPWPHQDFILDVFLYIQSHWKTEFWLIGKIFLNIDEDHIVWDIYKICFKNNINFRKKIGINQLTKYVI